MMTSSTAAVVISETVRQLLEKTRTGTISHEPPAREYNCPESTVRYYANTGRLRCTRLPSGIRLYARRDVERLARELASERTQERRPRAAS
jgi:DNA-binding transcriptional MerR regulator